MKRREDPADVRFVTFSCERRLPLLGAPEYRNVFARSLREARERLGFRLLAWVGMPEHVHLLIMPPQGAALAPALKSLKLSVQQRVLRLMRQRGDPLAVQIIRPDGAPRFWQKGGGFDRNVRSESELQQEIRYTHRNPVVRELVASPHEWRWSSVRWWNSRQRGGEHDADDVPCDWPPGNPRSWAMWEGYR